MRATAIVSSAAIGALALLVAGCSERRGRSPTGGSGPSTLGSTSAEQLSTAGAPTRSDPPTAGAAASAPVERHGIAWYEDAPEAAFAAARASGKRVVVDLWAPWCHTCLSMQSVVMTSDNLGDAVSRFVWLAIDTERDSNAGLLERLPVSVWPTFYVVDVAEPGRIDVQGRWLGAASVEQFRRFLAASERPTSGVGTGPGAASGPLEPLADADDLAARGRLAEAARAYALALERAPANWARRPETLVAQITALYKSKDYAACLRLGTSALNQTGSTASTVDFSSYALECAAAGSSEPAGTPAPSTDTVRSLRRAIAARLEPLCAVGNPELSPDDRADACDKLSQARAALGDAEGARQATQSRLAVLERAAHGKRGEAALTYDWARTDALLQLGRAEEALAVATEREQQVPGNYNPPHYRAKALKALGRWDEGLAAIERALSLAYGPRRVGLFTLKADLLFGSGRPEEAVRTLEEQLAAYRALPAGQRQPAAEARVEQRLREVRSKPVGAPAPGR